MAQQADGTVYINTLLDTTGFKAGGKDVEAAVRRMSKTVSGIGTTAKIALQKQTDAFIKANQAYAQQEQKVEALKNKLKELSEQKIETEEFKNISKELDAAEKRLDSYYGNLRKIEKAKLIPASEIRNEKAEIADLQSRVDSLTKQKASLPRGDFKAVGIGQDIEEYQKQIDALTEKIKQQEATNEKVKNSSPYQNAIAQIGIYQQKVEELRGKLESLNASGGAYKSADTSGVEQKLFAEQQRMQQMNNSLSTSYASLKGKVDSYSGSAINLASVKERLGKSFSSLLSTVKKTAKTIGGTLLSALKRAGAAMLNLHKSTKKSDRSIGSSLKSMLKYGLGIRSVFVLVNRLRSALVDGFKNLAQYDSRTNASISSLMSALTQLKNSFATAFAPILNVVSPILTQFINMISRAVTYVGMLIAALTGQDTFVRAKEVQEDYAGSLEDTANGYKDAAKSQNKYLSGLDEIRRFEAPDTSTSGSGNGGGGYVAPTPGDMFETVPVENSLKNLAEKLKEAWANADFTEIGNVLGEKLRDALDKIPWDKIKETAEKVGKSLATLINGAVETNGLADSVGRTVGELLNTGISGADAFVTNLHFDSIGEFIADAMNSAIKTIEWADFGALIRDSLNGVFKLASTWSEKFDFGALGESVKTFVNSALTGIKWEDAITAASNIGTGIATALNKFITPETFSNVGKTIAGAVNTAVAGAYSFLSTADFKTFANSVATGINDLIKETNWEDIGRTIGAGLQDAIDFVSTLIKDIKWKDVVKALQDLWKGISEEVDMGQVGSILLAALGAWLAANAVTAIGATVLSQIGTSIVNAIVTAITTGVSAVGFGPVLAAVGAALVAIFVVSKLIDFLKDVDWKAVGDGIVKFVSDAIGVIKSVIEFGVSLVKKGWDTVTGWINSLGNAAKGAISAGVSLVKSGWDTLSGWLGTLGNSIKGAVSAGVSLVKSGWDTLSGWLGTLGNSIKGAISVGVSLVKSGWDTVTGFIGKVNDVAVSIVATVKEGAGTALDKVKGAWDTIKDKTADLVAKAKDSSSGVIDKLKTNWESIKDKVSTLTGKASNASTNMFSTLKDYWGLVYDKTATLTGKAVNSAQRAANTLQSYWKAISSKTATLTGKAVNKASSVVSTLKGYWSSLKSKKVTLTAYLANKIKSSSAVGLRGLWDSVYSKVATLVTKVVNAYSATLSNLRSYWSSITTKVVTLTVNVAGAFVNVVKAIAGLLKRTDSGGIYKNGKWQKIEGYASGGVVNSAQIFMARENGMAELVGRIGRATAVMNNDQIVASVAAGVYRAVVAAFGKLQNYFASISISMAKIPYAVEHIQPAMSPINLNPPVMAQGVVIPPKATADSQKVQQLQQTIDGLNNLINRLNGIGTQQQSGGQNNTYSFTAQINRRTLFEEMMDEAELVRHSTGRNPFEMA